MQLEVQTCGTRPGDDLSMETKLRNTLEELFLAIGIQLTTINQAKKVFLYKKKCAKFSKVIWLYPVLAYSKNTVISNKFTT